MIMPTIFTAELQKDKNKSRVTFDCRETLALWQQLITSLEIGMQILPPDKCF